jgi:uncharacterized membrane protein
MDYISTTPNKVLMAQARESLKGLWGLAIGAVVVFILVLGACGIVPIIGSIAPLIIAGPMEVGLIIFSLAIARKQNAQLSQIFDGFKKFGVAVGANLLRMLFIFLWSLLLIVPGIIAGLSYAMTLYIVAESDSIGPLEAMQKSKEMMRGNRLKLFCLGWRFFGWSLLCMLTFGIGFLWLFPYAIVSYAQFYNDLKNKGAVAPITGS